MKSEKLITFLVLSLIFSIDTSAQSAESELKIGDKAPPLEVEAWINSDTIEDFTEGHVYLIGFSFLRCGPCIKAIPYLNQLALKHKGEATIISIFTHGDKIEGVKNFFLDKDENKVFVGVDAQRIMESKWMHKADQWAFPTYFLVDKLGKIAWFGGTNNYDYLDQSITMLLNDELVPSETEKLNSRKQN